MHDAFLMLCAVCPRLFECVSFKNCGRSIFWCQFIHKINCQDKKLIHTQPQFKRNDNSKYNTVTEWHSSLLLFAAVAEKEVLLKFDPNRNNRVNMCETAAAAIAVCENTVIKNYCYVSYTRKRYSILFISFRSHWNVCSNLFSVTFLHCSYTWCLCVHIISNNLKNDKC